MKKLPLALMCSLTVACSHTPDVSLPRAQNVDIDRFMGSWYVIANIPTFLEQGAHNAIESYQLDKDGSIATTFSFNEDGFDGVIKTYHPTGFVSESDNSLWDMQFIWPFKAEYVITYLSPDYQNTIIGRSARDYLWIMSRSPSINDQTYQSLIQFSSDMGYDTTKIQKVPQQWTQNDDLQDSSNTSQETRP